MLRLEPCNNPTFIGTKQHAASIAAGDHGTSRDERNSFHVFGF